MNKKVKKMWICSALFIFFLTGIFAQVNLNPGQTTIIEAEDGYLGQAVIESDHSGFTGSGYVNYANEPGSFIEWEVYASSGGSANCVFFYANGSTSRPVNVLLNGNVIINLPFNGTGEWTNWTAARVEISLNAGTNRIRLTATGAEGGPNIDRMEITCNGNTIITGDVNGDGAVNIIDALMTAQYYVYLAPSPFNATAADVNCDGEVNIIDALMIAQHYVGLTGAFSSCYTPTPSTPTPTPTPYTPPPGNLLPQDGNPVNARFDNYKKWIKSSINETKNQADIILSYQKTNGGFPKNETYSSPGSGGSDSGTIDNGATTTELTFFAYVYKQTGETKYRDSARKALDFLLNMQYSKGGFPQFYPLTGGYHDHATFNDDAMSRVLVVLDRANRNISPLDGDVFTASQRARLSDAVNRGVDYILKAQWVQNGKLTVWCAQHGADDYQPKQARAYELPSLSGSESVEVIGFLMTQPQTPEIEKAVRAAVDWFRSPDTYLADHTYDTSQVNPIVYRAGSKMWYRFYDLNTNRGFFSDRDSRKVYDIMQISEERRTGYSWGGNYGSKIIPYAEKVGY